MASPYASLAEARAAVGSRRPRAAERLRCPGTLGQGGALAGRFAAPPQPLGASGSRRRRGLSSGVASEPAGLFRLSHDLDTRRRGPWQGVGRRTSTASLLKSPRSPAERLISPEHEVTALQDLAKGEAVEGQLVETRGLQMMLLFEPDKIIGLRSGS